MVRAALLDREYESPGKNLADHLTRSKSESPANPWLKSLNIDKSSFDEHPYTTQVIIQTDREVKPGNEEITLRNYVRAIEPALKSHQKNFGGGKIRIDLQTPEAALRKQKFETKEEGPLTKSEYKRLRRELKDLVWSVGVKKPVITLYTSRLNGRYYNLAIVEGNFTYDNLPVLRKIHSLYKPTNNSIKQNAGAEESLNVDVRFSVPSRMNTVNSQVKQEIISEQVRTTSHLVNRGGLVEAAETSVNAIITANPRSVRDLRHLKMLSLDTYGTIKPEDLIHIKVNPDNTISEMMSSPFVLSPMKYYMKGVPNLSLNIEKMLFPNRDSVVCQVQLAVVKQAYKLSSDIADQILEGKKIKKTGRSGVTDEAEEIILRMSEATKLSAKRSLVLGSAIKNAILDPGDNTLVPFASFDMVTEMIVSTQRAFASYLAGHSVPFLARRTVADYSPLLPELSAIFPNRGNAMIAMLGTDREDLLFSLLKTKGRNDLINLVGYCRTKAQSNPEASYAAISDMSELHELDRAPFKPRHGNIAYQVNHLQLAAFSLGLEPMSIDVLRNLALRIDTLTDNCTNIILSESEDIRRMKLDVSKALKM